MVSPHNEEDNVILPFSDIEASSHEGRGNKESFSNYAKDLWLATGCISPYDDDLVVGCPDYVKSTLSSMKNTVLSTTTLCEQENSGSYHSYYRAYKKWVHTSVQASPSDSSNSDSSSCHLCPGFSHDKQVLWVRSDLGQSYIAHRAADKKTREESNCTQYLY